MAESSIPVIDISIPSLETAQRVLYAATTHGFLFIANDGVTIPPNDIDEMFSLSESFFSHSAPQKQKYAIHTASAGGPNRGYVALSGEALDPSGTVHGDPKEAFNIGPPYPSLQPLPSPLSESAALITRFQKSCHALCTNILSLLGVALELEDENYFADRHDQAKGASGTIFRMLYYPATPPPSPTSSQSIRAGAHSDYGSLTLLFRLPGQPGLELHTPSGWVPVPVNPHDSPHPPILVNIGDLLCFWTNGLLKSTVHRVAFEGGEGRYSMAYFCHPLDSVKLEGVGGRVVTEFGDGGREELEGQRERLGLVGEEGVITAKEHLERRLRVTYGI